MARRRPNATIPDKDLAGIGDKRGGYTGGVEARKVPPPEKVPSAYQPVTDRTSNR
jgi:hypothetical protein